MKIFGSFSQTILFVASVMTVLAGLAIPFSFAHAQTETDTSPSAELREIIRQRIEETIQDKKTTTPEYIGTLGTISKVGTGTFTITDSQGRERTIEISPNTTILLNGKKAELKDLSINAGAVIMGSALDEVIINAKRILVQDAAFTETREVFLGSITGMNSSQITFTARATDETVTANLLRTSEYEDSIGNEISVRDIEEDQAILIITNIDKNDQRFVEKLRLLIPIDSIETDN